MSVNTGATIDLMKSALGQASEDLNKSFTQSLGLTAYDLQAPALSLYPVLTPTRNMLPRVGGGGDTATRWRAVTGINVNNIAPHVTEGNRGAVVSTSVANFVAPYCGIGLEDFVTFEANYAAQGFEDVKARAALGLLQSVMIGEEALLFGGNYGLALGQTPTPTAVGAATGGTIAAGTYSVICIALTQEGFRRANLSTGVVGTTSKTNIDGSVDTVPGGSARQSAAAAPVVGAGGTGSISASVAVVNGAVAYAWFVGAAGAEKLAQITTINSAVFATVPVTGQLASSLPAVDNSANVLGMDGLLTFAFRGGSVIASQSTGIAGAGTPLTGDGSAGIVEIIADFRAFWEGARLSPDTIWAHSQEIYNISKKVISGGAAPLFRVNIDANAARAGVQGGMIVDGILNPFTGTMVDLKIHPTATAGTLLYTAKTVPYPLSGLGNIAQVKTRQEYYQLQWPVTKRRYEYGVYADEVLQVQAPFAFGVRSNIANG